jgi:T5SS/PEP-CTERM-associated repeat protein
MNRTTFCLGLLSVILASVGFADDIRWTGEQGDAILTYESQGSWFDGMNWLNFTVPTSADRVIFDPQSFARPLPNPYCVFFGDFYKYVFMGGSSHVVPANPNPAEAGSVDIAGLHWIFNFDCFDPENHTDRNTGSLMLSGNLNVGTTSVYTSATLEITGPGVLECNAAMLGGPDDTHGILTVDHTDMVLHDGGLLVGDNGRGTLDVEGGAISCFSAVHVGNAGGGRGNVMVNGDDSVLSAERWLSVGEYGSGQLTISGGGCVDNAEGRVGWYAGSTGTVMVTDSGSAWDCFFDVRIGDEGEGALTIKDGGEAHVDTWVGIGYGATGDGTATVTDAGSSWTIVDTLNVAEAGIGSLEIKNGGSVDDAHGFIGNGATGQGEVTVTGANSTWTNSGLLTVGNAGQGTLDVLAGGHVTAGEVIVGWGPGSHGEAVVSGTGSNLNNSGGTTVGFNASGSLVVQNGASLANTFAHIGNGATGQGEVTVTGENSAWTNSGLLTVGNAGHGTLDVLAGGHVTAGELIIGWGQGSHGDVTVDGPQSLLEDSGETTVGYDAYGSLAVTGLGTTTSSYATVGRGQTGEGSATVSGRGSRWSIDNDLTVGGSGHATLSILNGGLVDVGRALTIDGNGGDDSFINMTTGGMLALFGDADDSLVDFLNLINGTDAIRFWDDSVSHWAAITGATPGTDYTLAYIDDADSDLDGYTLLTVRTVPLCGDANGDGRVDDVDASILGANWRRTGDATWNQGDFNGDHNVDDRDAAILAAHWHESVEQTPSVPEPTTWVLLLGLSLALLRRRGSTKTLCAGLQ